MFVEVVLEDEGLEEGGDDDDGASHKLCVCV